MTTAGTGRTDTLSEASDLAIVNDVARIALEDLELRPMLQRIVHSLKSHLRCELVTCATINQQTQRCVCEALESDRPGAIAIGYSAEIGTGVVGEVAASGRSILVADTRLHPRYLHTIVGVRSELCVPVLRGNEVIAVLNAESLDVDAFRDRVLLMETVADQIAGAIAAARLNNELRQRVELLGMMSELLRVAVEADDADQALDRIVVYVLEHFSLELCAILLVDENDRLVLKAEAGKSTLIADAVPDWPARIGITGRAFRTGATQFVPDVAVDPDYVMGNPAVRSEYVVPIRFRDQLLGMIDMESTSVESFTAKNRGMLDALAAQIAGAIHLTSTNRRLIDTNRIVAEKSAALEKANAQLQEANAVLHRISNLDGLTGIANRRRFVRALAGEWRRARRLEIPLGLLLIDIDDFKAFNDGYGHQAGDECLKRVALRMEKTLGRAGNVLARYGGEEFAVLLPRADLAGSSHCAQHVAEAIASLRIPHEFARASDYLTVSIGVTSLVPSVGSKPSVFIGAADRALYRAKNEGRNRIVTSQDPASPEVAT